MNLSHFLPECAFKVAGRVYARLIEWDRSANALFDAVDADWFAGENSSSQGPLTTAVGFHSRREPRFTRSRSTHGSAKISRLWNGSTLGRLPKWLALQIFERRTWPG